MTYEIDSIICMMRYYMKADIALLSIIDDNNDRQIFRSHTGLMPEYERKPETPLSHSFCLSVRNTANTVVVNDARLDPRFRHNPAIEELQVVSYLGAPVFETRDRPIGAACVISGKKRVWMPAEVNFIRSVSDILTGMLHTLHQAGDAVSAGMAPVSHTGGNPEQSAL